MMVMIMVGGVRECGKVRQLSGGVTVLRDV